MIEFWILNSSAIIACAIFRLPQVPDIALPLSPC